MSDDQPPPGMSGADQFAMNMANKAASGGGGESGGIILSAAQRLIGIDFGNSQGFPLDANRFMQTTIPSMFASLGGAKSYMGSWLEDLIERLKVQFDNIFNAGGGQAGGGGAEGGGGEYGGGGGEYGGGGDGDSGVHLGGDGGGGHGFGAPAMFEHADFSDNIAPPRMPDMGGGHHAVEHEL